MKCLDNRIGTNSEKLGVSEKRNKARGRERITAKSQSKNKQLGWQEQVWCLIQKAEVKKED